MVDQHKKHDEIFTEETKKVLTEEEIDYLIKLLNKKIDNELSFMK